MKRSPHKCHCGVPLTLDECRRVAQVLQGDVESLMPGERRAGTAAKLHALWKINDEIQAKLAKRRKP